MKKIYEYLDKTLCGFCNGFFVGENYDNKRIEAIGKDWIVARTPDGEVCFAKFMGEAQMLEYLKEWAKEPGDGEL